MDPDNDGDNDSVPGGPGDTDKDAIAVPGGFVATGVGGVGYGMVNRHNTRSAAHEHSQHMKQIKKINANIGRV